MMRTTIWREFRFEAAHRLPLVPANHKCARLHGHSYRVEVHVEGEVGADGMVVDFAVLKEAWAPLHEVLDHRYLNDVPGLDNPTSERLALLIAEEISLPQGVRLTRIVVAETCTSGCVVTCI
jgi:6-pyruvoyltetrahydropterin/6-carboxytetrahydropterin synthase